MSPTIFLNTTTSETLDQFILNATSSDSKAFKSKQQVRVCCHSDGANKQWEMGKGGREDSQCIAYLTCSSH